MHRGGRQAQQDIIIEMHQLGSYVKASAIDAATGIEVSVIGSSASPDSVLRNAAVRKLRYVLENRKGPAREGRGILV